MQKGVYRMKINIIGQEIKITDSLQEMIEDHLEKFDRYFDDRTIAEVKLKPVQDQIKLEITLNIDRHYYYRAEAVRQDARTAMQNAVDIMEGQIRKHKSKLKRQRKQFAHMKHYLAEQENSFDIEEDESKITREKSFNILPMDAEEATLQMEMLGHDFFAFLNGDTGKVNLVYKRHDDDYGWIELEY